MDSRKDLLAGSRAAVWPRWLLLAFFVIVWVLIIRSYPVYFQRDDAAHLYWSQHHTFIQAFIPTKDNALQHDGMYRPFRELGWLCQYKLFGMNSYGYHFTLGVLLILTLVFLFKLTARISSYAAAYLMVFLWLGGFQFLLSNLFWFSDLPHLLEMLLMSAGLYLFISGFGRSRGSLLAGLLLVLMAFFAKEPAIVIGPAAAATYLLTTGGPELRWSKKKTVFWSLLVLSVGPVYVLFFPYVFNKMAPGVAVETPSVALVLRQLGFYSLTLTSGITGLALITPAVYFLATRIMPYADGKASGRFPIYLVVVLLMTLAIVKSHLWPLGMLVIIAAAFAMPKSRYFLLPWAFVPLAGACFFSFATRTYLLESSLALTILAAIQAHVMLRGIVSWWKERISNRAISYAAVALVAVCITGLLAVKIKNQTAILRMRSDSSLTLKKITPVVLRLPAGSTLVMADYESMGWKIAYLPNEEKVFMQSPISWIHIKYWLRINGKEDQTLVQWSEYLKDPQKYHRHCRVFLWLQTPAERDAVEKLGLATRPFGSASQGRARSVIVEL